MLDLYIERRIRRGGPEDVKAAKYARLLKEQFGDEPIDPIPESPESELRLFIPYMTRRGSRLAVVTNEELRLLSPREVNFLDPLVVASGEIVPDQVIRDRLILKPPYRNYLDIIYACVKKKLEPDPSNAKYITRINGKGFKLTGFDPSGFLEHTKIAEATTKESKRYV